MYFMVRVGGKTYPRKDFMDLENQSGQRLLSSAKTSSSEVLCLCTTVPQILFIRKTHGKFVLVKKPGTGALHHADCPSVRDYSGYSSTEKTYSIEQCISSFIKRKHTFEDLRFILNFLWVQSGLSIWKPGYLDQYHVIKHKLKLTLAAAKISLGEYTLADLLVFTEISFEQEDDPKNSFMLIDEIKRKIDKYGVSPLLIARVSGIKPSKFSYMVSIKDFNRRLWLNTSFYEIAEREHAFFFNEIERTKNVFGIFEVRLTGDQNINVSHFGLSSMTEQGLPYPNKSCLTEISKAIKGNQSIEIELEKNGNLRVKK